MAYIGNSPGVASQRITTTFTATAGQTTFTPTSGYTVGYIDVFVNGVKLINGSDFTASNGTTVVLTAAASADDVVETVAFLPRGLSDGYTKAEADARYMSASATTLPSQTNNAGKFLKTDGTDATWETVPTPTPAAVSSQTNTATDYFALPVGTTAQRPGSPASGMVRMNSTTGEPEWYDTGSNAWIPFGDRNYQVDYLLVAGGGGGGDTRGGGGGAGGMVAENYFVSRSTSYPIVVGAGGSGATTDFVVPGSNGQNSSVFGATTIGGGGGGSRDSTSSQLGNGVNGGSGGGGAGDNGGSGGSGTSGQGNNGGNSGVASTSNSGGGGGGGKGAAGSTGSTASSGAGGNGGAGAQWLDGNYYAGGGGGGSLSSGGSGGIGGGGNANSGPGTQNTGGGGAGGTGSGGNGGNGGSGIVIIRYSGSQRGTGGTVTSSGGYTYHTFTSSGTFTA